MISTYPKSVSKLNNVLDMGGQEDEDDGDDKENAMIVGMLMMTKNLEKERNVWYVNNDDANVIVVSIKYPSGCMPGLFAIHLARPSQ